MFLERSLNDLPPPDFKHLSLLPPPYSPPLPPIKILIIHIVIIVKIQNWFLSSCGSASGFNRHWISDHTVVQAAGSSPGGDIYHFLSGMIFISVLLGVMDFSDIVILCSRPNRCCQQNLKCFDMTLLSSDLFS